MPALGWGEEERVLRAEETLELGTRELEGVLGRRAE